MFWLSFTGAIMQLKIVDPNLLTPAAAAAVASSVGS